MKKSGRVGSSKGLALILALAALLFQLTAAKQQRQSMILNNEESRVFNQAKQEAAKAMSTSSSGVSSTTDYYDGELFMQHADPVVGQESSYGGYVVPKEPFSMTDRYQYMEAFLIGLRLAETYDYSDECIDDIVLSIDDGAYYQNNKTNHTIEMEAGRKKTRFEPYLNITGMIGGPVATSIPNCYQFGFDFYTYESERFQQFNSNWGNFFLAFLFNQMGNALNFQQKFENIRENNENQQYQATYQEYGDLVYDIWNFEPLEEASLDNLDEFVAKWLEENEWVTEETTDGVEMLMSTGVKTASRYVHAFGEQFGVHHSAFKRVVNNWLDAPASPRIEQKRANVRESLANIGKPKVGNTGQQAAIDTTYGIFTGMIDVFPYESNPQRCSSNSSEGYDAFDRLFLAPADARYDLKTEDGRLDFVSDVSTLLATPFGFSYSCYWGFSTILIKSDPYEDGKLTEDEELELKIVLINDIVTNLFFNMGYIYADIVSLVAMTGDNYVDPNPSQSEETERGIYIGDILIRFFWRKYFIRNFEY